MKFVIALLLSFSALLVAFVPATADYMVFVKDFGKINEVFQIFEDIPDETDGFVCFFGKFVLNFSAFFNLFAEEDLRLLGDAIDLSVVTNKPQWIGKYLESILKNLTVIEANDLTYFCSPIMVDHVRAMLNGELPAAEFPMDYSIYGKSKFIVPFGGLMHLLGLSEGLPLYDEFIVQTSDETINLKVFSHRLYQYEWEMNRLRQKFLPEAMKFLKEADLIVAMPVWLLSQIPREMLEEFDLELDKYLPAFEKSKAICLSFSQDFSKMVFCFDFRAEDLESIKSFFEELGADVKENEDFVFLALDELEGILPKSGGVGTILANVKLEELTNLETNLLVKLYFKQEELFVNFSAFMSHDSLVVQAEISKDFLAEILEEFSSEFDSGYYSEELNVLQTIIDQIDELYFSYSINPPISLEELIGIMSLDEFIPAEYLRRVIYENTYENGIFTIRVSIDSDLVGTRFFSPEDVEIELYIFVDEILLDYENGRIILVKRYEEIAE